MAVVNRPTHKQNQQDFFDRIPGLTPLIQKSEDDVIRDEGSDSTIFRVAEVAGITGPAAAFNADFTTGDRIDVNSIGEATTNFTITLVGLNDNETGIINITKLSLQTFSFANGSITPFDNTNGQINQTSIRFFVKVINGIYVVQAGYDVGEAGGDLQGDYPNLTLRDDTVDTAAIAPDAVEQVHLATGTAVETDGSQQVRSKIVEIGAWDMLTDDDTTVVHGVDRSKIRTVTVMIRDDFNVNTRPLITGSSSATTGGYVFNINNTTIQLERLTGGTFEAVSYDGIGWVSSHAGEIVDNRGWITIEYVV